MESQAGVMHEVVKMPVELIEPSYWCCFHACVSSAMLGLDETIRSGGGSSRRYSGSCQWMSKTRQTAWEVPRQPSSRHTASVCKAAVSCEDEGQVWWGEVETSWRRDRTDRGSVWVMQGCPAKILVACGWQSLDSNVASPSPNSNQIVVIWPAEPSFSPLHRKPRAP
jgi:hypothetical protein